MFEMKFGGVLEAPTLWEKAVHEGYRKLKQFSSDLERIQWAIQNQHLQLVVKLLPNCRFSIMACMSTFIPIHEAAKVGNMYV